MIVELVQLQSTPAPNPVQLHIMVSGDLVISIVGVVGCDGVRDTSILDSSVGGIGSLPSNTCVVELGTSVEGCSVPDIGVDIPVGMDTPVGSIASCDIVQDVVGSLVDPSVINVSVHDTTPFIVQQEDMVSPELVVSDRIAGDDRQLATS